MNLIVTWLVHPGHAPHMSMSEFVYLLKSMSINNIVMKHRLMRHDLSNMYLLNTSMFNVTIMG